MRDNLKRKQLKKLKTNLNKIINEKTIYFGIEVL